MALPFLRLPSSLHPHLSLPFSKPHSSSPFTLSLSSPPKTCTHLKARPQSSHLFHQHFTHLTTQTRCSPTATPTVAEDEEGVKELVEVYDRRRLYVQNIPWTCTAEDIRALFEKYGTVLDVELSMYNRSNNRGLAFITMATEEAATQALNNLTSYDLDGRIIKVDYSRSTKKTPVEIEVPIQKYTVYAGNLAWRVRSKDLEVLFSGSGMVVSAEVIYQSKPRRPAGYGFVSFASKEEAEAAISTLNGKEFMGRPLRLGFSKLPTDCVVGQNNAEVSGEVNANGKSEVVENEA